MSKSIFQNVPDPEVFMSMKPEVLAGYLLEHLHSITTNRRQRFHSENLASEISRGYPNVHEERISDVVKQGYQWLKNRDYIFDRTTNGFFDFTDKGRQLRTAEEFHNSGRSKDMIDSSIATELMDKIRGARKQELSDTSPGLGVNTKPLLNNRYRVLSTFPSSGFGQAFLAEDEFLPSKRKCVVKHFAYSPNNPETHQLMRERFDREAVNLEKLAEGSEQIPDLYAHFSENGQFYLVQEYIKGETVAAKLSAGGYFSESTVKDLLRSILSILKYVHSHSVIHRDIKPENIMLREEDGKPFLIDFGAIKEIARTVVDPFGNPSTTIVIGTPGYMPTEQALGRPVFASDLYCLGLTAIFMLTGKRPQELSDLRTGEIAWHHHARDVSRVFVKCCVWKNSGGDSVSLLL